MLWPPTPFHNRRGTTLILVLAATAGVAVCQTLPASAASGGQGEIGFQGDYLGGASQPFLNVTGAFVHLQQFMPGIGFLTGDLEGYGAQNRFAPGVNFLELRGAPWMGRYWTVTAGDFHTSAALVEFPFANVFNPEIEARGFQIQAAHGDTQYAFFDGEQTLAAGTRVSYRVTVPQTVTGASATRRVAAHLQTGARLMQFAASPQAIIENPVLFPAGRTAGTVRTLAGQSLYTPLKSLKLYAEVSRPLGAAQPTVTSAFTGVAWEPGAFSFKADYTHEGILYFPLAGYFAGDRQGPYGEARWRLSKTVELYGSASRYGNNLEHDQSVPSLHSFSTTGGAAALLPGGVSASLTVSTLNFSQLGGGEQAVSSKNEQINATLTRAIRRHTLEVTWRDIQMATALNPQRQRTWEAGDNFQTRHFSLGGAARYQQMTTGAQVQDSLFFRGLAQGHVGRFSAYGSVEIGNDLANQTLFSTDAYRTSVVGVAVRLVRGWNLQTEMYRNLLNLTLNPASVFLLQDGGALAGISPAALALGATSQWSFFFRLSKQIRWGAGLPAEKPDQLTVKAAALTGTVTGTVRVKTLAGASAAAGIAVTLDGGRAVVSGADGRYVLEDVPEGRHDVALSLTELPADFDPGPSARVEVLVEPRHTVPADFDILPLVAVSGRVTGPEGAALGGIVIRMAPGDRYTITGDDGAFHFFNVREGDAVFAVDPKTLPEGGTLTSAGNISLAVRAGALAAPIEFHFAIHSRPKPIRKVLEIKH